MISIKLYLFLQITIPTKTNQSDEEIRADDYEEYAKITPANTRKSAIAEVIEEVHPVLLKQKTVILAMEMERGPRSIK